MKLNKALRLAVAMVMALALLCAPALAKTVSPGADFYYLDNANVLSEAVEGEIYFSNKLLNEACGAQIVVVTLDTTGREAIDDYAYDLFNAWGIGDAAKGNGFLLLLAIGDDDYYYCTGIGLDSSLSRGTLTQYRDDYLEGDFAAKRYEDGVRKFFEAVFARISSHYNTGITVQDGIAAYNEYSAKNTSAQGFGGYTGSRRVTANNNTYRDESDGFGTGFGFLIFVMLLVALVVVMSKGRRARRSTVILPPPPPPPMGIGYRPTRTVYHSSFTSPPRRTSGWGSGSSFGGGSSRSSFGGGRSSFGGSSRSSGFGGGSGGGGRTAGGGGGRGRH
ncbi:MAG: TPM domain-containing protein [Clostridia bacterium]|nr:TPM domain-containing protein [Clostridia bacterium]